MKNKAQKPKLFISYFTGVQGCCPAEWADDKILALSEAGQELVVVSGMLSRKINTLNIHHYRVPSLSWGDVKYEYNHLKMNGEKIPYVRLIALVPFILTIGVSLDLAQRILTSGLGGSKWSWTISSFFTALFLKLRFGCQDIFTTGGPASAHVCGIMVKKLVGGRLYCELQDPLVGDEIGRTKKSGQMLLLIEQWIVKAADKIVYVTKTAAREAKKRHENYAHKIVAIYPGSRRFILEKENVLNSNALEIIHLGTLYSTRNLYTLIEAIDQLILEKKIKDDEIKITNLGDIYGEIHEHHLSRNYVNQLPIKPREEAVKYASKKMVSLLVQHADKRSSTTIPYKTYDYINIGNPILGLTNSDELSDLLISNGHTAIDINNVVAIKNTLLSLINNYDEYRKCANKISVDINKQASKIFDL